jgi:tetratricopeptide (TPR) repeat protein
MRKLGTRISFAEAVAIFALGVGTLAAPTRAQDAAKTPATPTNEQQGTPAQSSAPQKPKSSTTCTVDVSPKKYSPALTEALRLYRTGKFDESAAAYNSIISSGTGGPEEVLAYTGLTRVYLKQERVSDAFAAASKAVALTPGKTPAITALGEVYFRQGKLQQAEDSFLGPLKTCDIDARSYLGLARIYRATSNYKRAKIAVDQAIKLDADDPDIQRSYMATLSRSEMVKYLRDYLSRETDDDAEHRRHMEEQLEVMEDAGRQHKPVCQLVSKVTATQTQLEALLAGPTQIRGYGLRVKINGASAKLMLDTGAGGITIDKKVADKAGIKKIAESDVRGIGDKGAAAGYFGFVDSIQIGDLQFEGCYVDVVARGSVLGDDGLIGADVFENFLVDLDFPDGKFKLSQLPPYPDEMPQPQQTSLESEPGRESRRHDRYFAPDMKGYTPIFRFGHMLLIPTAVNDSPDMLFAMDTGAFDNSITPAAAKQVTKINRDDNFRVKGLSGDVKDVYVADKANLRFAHLKQDRQGLVTFSLDNISKSLGTEVSGTLGFRMLVLLDIKIDYRDGLVDFTYTPIGARR